MKEEKCYNGKGSLEARVSSVGKTEITPYDNMEDIAEEIKPEPISEEERQLRQYEDQRKHLLIGRAKASVVRKQVVEAYEILDSIRFDYCGDTAFREKIVVAKKELESAINDFLLSDQWRELKVKEHQDKTPKEYDEYMKELSKGVCSQVEK